MYRDEEKDNVYGNFFNHIDSFPEPTFLFVTSGGIKATKSSVAKVDDEKNRKEKKRHEAELKADSDDDADDRKDDKLGNEG